MTALEPQPPNARAAPARVEVIDNWHADWPTVLAVIDRQGLRARVGIDADGWLPARRSLVVAFVDDRPAGHLSFRIDPVVTRTAGVRTTHVEATVESTDVGDAFNADAIAAQLHATARTRAADLSCVRFNDQ